MANKIEYSNVDAVNNYVNATSRYATSAVIYYGEHRRITFTTYKKRFTALSDNDRFVKIPAGMEYRPDKVSREYYGTVDFWWKILEVNNISDIFDFKVGRTIRLPSNIF